MICQNKCYTLHCPQVFSRNNSKLISFRMHSDLCHIQTLQNVRKKSIFRSRLSSIKETSCANNL